MLALDVMAGAPAHQPADEDATEEQPDLFAARLKAAAGDPWDWIALQWGRIVRAAEIEADPLLWHDLRQTDERFLILDGFQTDIIASVMDPTMAELFIKGNTGSGKGGATAIAACTYYAVHHDSKVVLTRDSHRRAKAVLFGEVAKWWARMAAPPPTCELQSDRIVDTHPLRRTHVCEVVNPGSPEGFRGTHSSHVMFLFDEATHRVLESRYSLAYTQSTILVAAANPSTTHGKFRSAFGIVDDPDRTQTVVGPRGRRRLITIGGEDCLNVRMQRLDKPISPPGGITIRGERFEAGVPIPDELRPDVDPIIPGQTTYDTFLGHLADHDPAWVRVYAHGQFPDENPECQLIFAAWVRRAADEWGRYERMRRWVAGRPANHWAVKTFRKHFSPTALGLDVGASRKGDPSVLTAGNERGILAQHTARCDDAEALADWVVKTIRDVYAVDVTAGYLPIAIDADGVGWGLEGILRRRRCNTIVIHGNAPSTVDPKRYANLRAEAYGELAMRLDPAGRWKSAPLMLPPAEELKADLTAVERVYQQDGIKFGLTPKRPVPGVDKDKQPPTLIDRLGRSPDYGDSAVYWFRALQAAGVSLGDTLLGGFW